MLSGFLGFLNAQGNLPYRLKNKLPDAKLVYNRDELTGKITRMLIGSHERVGKFAYQGIIVTELDVGYKVISVPPLPPDSRLPMEIKGDTAVKVKDGTTVTLYYYDKWVISTFRGYEVNHLLACPTATFEALLQETLEQYPDFSYDKLDTNKSYTIGFSHPDIHPAITNKEAWFVQSVDLIKFNQGQDERLYDEDIGIPQQESLTFTDIKTLQALAADALGCYVATGEENLGYIIRNGLRFYYIESTLMESIRLMYYENKPFMKGHSREDQYQCHSQEN